MAVVSTGQAYSGSPLGSVASGQQAGTPGSTVRVDRGG